MPQTYDGTLGDLPKVVKVKEIAVVVQPWASYEARTSPESLKVGPRVESMEAREATWPWLGRYFPKP